MANFPTKEELMAMNLKTIRLVVIPQFESLMTPEQEALLQEVVNKKIEVEPVQQEVYRGDMPGRSADSKEIQSPEEEAAYQKKVDERVATMRARSQVKPEISAEKVDELQEGSTVVESVVETKEPAKEVKKFCEQCASKGHRHLKDCPTLKK